MGCSTSKAGSNETRVEPRGRKKRRSADAAATSSAAAAVAAAAASGDLGAGAIEGERSVIGRAINVRFAAGSCGKHPAQCLKF